MSGKPVLTLHPGLPKCATSTIQRLFVIEDNALGRALDVGVIGRDFRPNNGYPDVSKLMYRPDDFLCDVTSAEIAPGAYFASNEAFPGSPEVIRAITTRFDIRKTVFTTRFPVGVVHSAYCYSGWLFSTFEDFLKQPGGNPRNLIGNFRRKLDRFREVCNDIALCPIVSTCEPLGERFTRIAFGRVPDILSQPTFAQHRRSNASIGMAFAEALHVQIRKRNIEVAPADRHKLALAAQHYSLPDDLALATIPAIAAEFQGAAAIIDEYREFLIAYAVEPGEAVQAAQTALQRLVSAPVASERSMKLLQEHADALLDKHFENFGSATT